MIISVRIKLFLNIFNYKVIFIFYLNNKFGWKIFFNYKTIGFIIIWLNITLIKTKKIEVGFCQKQKFQYGDFIFISQLLNDMKYDMKLHSLC